MSALLEFLPNWPRPVWLAIAIITCWFIAMGEDSYE